MTKTKSQEILEKAGIATRLSLAEKILSEDGKPRGTRSTGEHRVKFLEDKVVKGKDYQTGVERLEMKWIFEDENGQKKFYTKPLRDENNEVNYLIQRMASFNYGDELILKYTKREGSIRGYIEVKLENAPQGENDKLDLIEEKEISDEEILSVEEF